MRNDDYALCRGESDALVMISKNDDTNRIFQIFNEECDVIATGILPYTDCNVFFVKEENGVLYYFAEDVDGTTNTYHAFIYDIHSNTMLKEWTIVDNDSFVYPIAINTQGFICWTETATVVNKETESNKICLLKPDGVVRTLIDYGKFSISDTIINQETGRILVLLEDTPGGKYYQKTYLIN